MFTHTRRSRSWMTSAALALAFAGTVAAISPAHSTPSSQRIEVKRQPMATGSGMCMTDDGSYIVRVFGCANTEGSSWDFRHQSGNLYTIVSSKTGRCLDANSGRREAQVGTCNGGKFQLWNQEVMGEGLIKLWNYGIKSSDKELKCLQLVRQSGMPAYVLNCAENTEQYFRFLSS